MRQVSLVKLNSLLHLGQLRERRTLDQVGEFATFIGPGSAFTGTFRGRDNYIVFGSVQGDCDLEGALILGETGCWTGNIAAHFVVIAGTVTGDVTAREKIELASTARVRGTLKSPVIAMAEGAVHEGAIHMSATTQFVRFSDRRRTPSDGSRDTV